MENDLHRIRIAAENMDRLMEELVALQKECRQCCRAVTLPPEESVKQPENPGPEETFNHAQAAYFLERSEKQVYRYRRKGDLAFSLDEQGRICYTLAELERLFEKIHGFPKGGFGE